MNSDYTDDDNNFWPSICDLFLVFFICALVIAGVHARQAMVASAEVVSMTAEREKGDSDAMADLVFEVRRFLNTISSDAKAKLELSYSMEDYHNDHAEQGTRYLSYPRLIAVLSQSYHSKNWTPNARINYSQDFNDLTSVVHALSLRVGVADSSDINNVIALKVTMRLINEKLNQAKEEAYTREADINDRILQTNQSEIRKLINKIEQLNKLNNDLLERNNSQARTIENMQAKASRAAELEKNSITIDNEMRSILMSLTESGAQLTNKQLLKRLKDLHINGKFDVVVSLLNEDVLMFESGAHVHNDSTSADEALNNICEIINSKISKVMNMGYNYRLYIEVCGHTDEKGFKDYNAALGLKRATHIKSELKKRLNDYHLTKIVWRLRSAGESQLYENVYLLGVENREMSRRITIKIWAAEAPSYERKQEIDDPLERT